MTFKPVRPGTPVREAIKSRTLNQLFKSESSPRITDFALDRQEPRLEIIGQLSSAASSTDRIEPYQPVLIRTPIFELNTNAIDNATRVPNEFCFEVDMLADYNQTDHGWLPSWGIAQEAITQERAGKVLMTGMSWLSLEGTVPSSSLPSYRGIDIVNGVFTYDLMGRAEIIGNINNTKSHCMVHIARRYRAGLYVVTKTGGIAAGGSALCTVVKPQTSTPFWADDTLDIMIWNPSRTTPIDALKRAFACEYVGRWMAVFTEC
jgi:hypothetical protein